jgi:hypothetical protein
MSRYRARASLGSVPTVGPPDPTKLSFGSDSWAVGRERVLCANQGAAGCNFPAMDRITSTLLDAVAASAVGLLACAPACTPGPAGQGLGGLSGGETTSGGDASGQVGSEGASEGVTGLDGDGDASGDHPKLDVDPGPGGAGACSMLGLDAIGDCRAEAPPRSFAPVEQWSWSGESGDAQSLVTPLVANLTDDDGNGSIDPCDVPDVVVTAFTDYWDFEQPATIHVLDGATGTEHFQVPVGVHRQTTSAIGDIDGDGMVEIVSVTFAPDDGPYHTGALVAFEHDGTTAWISTAVDPLQYAHSVALADLDADGDVEIMVGTSVYDHQGQLLWIGPQGMTEATAVDLDGDGDLEVIMGNAAYHHDGTLMFAAPHYHGGSFPAVADVDDDGLPEVLFVHGDGLTVVEHDGAIAVQDWNPVAMGIGNRLGSLHDFDGDGAPDLLHATENGCTMFDVAGLEVSWTAPLGPQAQSAATAFDFLGDGTAEALYADNSRLYAFGPTGTILFDVPRTTGGNIDYPVVADVDNDGSAEIVVTSNAGYAGEPPAPAVRVYRDADDRWIQARRIWNQSAYFVTNVREDGTIPQHQPAHWNLLNTYRTNAQIEDGWLCDPRPEG